MKDHFDPLKHLREQCNCQVYLDNFQKSVISQFICIQTAKALARDKFGLAFPLDTPNLSTSPVLRLFQWPDPWGSLWGKNPGNRKRHCLKNICFK